MNDIQAEKGPRAWLRQPEELIACVALTIVVLSTSWGVFTRYVSAQPATWTAEIAAVGFCWAIFMGGAAAFRRGQHISIDMLVQLLPSGPRRALAIAVDLLVLVFLMWVCWLAILFTIDSWDTPMPSLRWPYAIHYVGAVCGLAAMALRHALAARARLAAPRAKG